MGTRAITGKVRGMPDQSSASSEHALMQEITAPLSTLPDDPMPVVADPDFAIVLRGYDRDSVDDYVQRTSQLVAELQATRSPEAAVRRALERVGEEVSGILQRAHETASRITAQSRSEAEDRLEAARQEAAQIVQRAEERVRELDAETDRIWAERHRIVEDTRELARELLTITDSAADRFPPDPAVGGESGLGGDSALPGLEAVPPAGIEAVPPVPGAVEPEDAASEAATAGEVDEDAEPTVIMPVFERPEWVEPKTLVEPGVEGSGEDSEGAGQDSEDSGDSEEEHRPQ
jgi:vacuolar-type H+-ATPase subunit H